MAGGSAGRWMIGPLTRGIQAFVLSGIAGQSLVGLLARASGEDLAVMHELLVTGKVRPVSS